MLTANLDLDMLPAEGDYPWIATLLIAGTYYEDESFDRDFSEWQSHFLPWNWPNVNRWVFWEIDGGTLARLDDIAPRVEDLSDFENDAEKLKEFYAEELSKRIPETAGIDFDHAVCWPASIADRTTVTRDEFSTPPFLFNGTMLGKTSGFSVALPPMNVALKMCHFVDIPEGWIDKTIVAFPLFNDPSGDELDWGQDEPSVTLDAASQIVTAEYNVDGAVRKLVSRGAEVARTVETESSLVRIHSEADNDESSLCAKNMRIFDTEDWMRGLRRRASSFFDTPRLLLDFAFSKVSQLQELTEEEHVFLKVALEACREFVWHAGRDIANFGQHADRSDSDLAISIVQLVSIEPIPAGNVIRDLADRFHGFRVNKDLWKGIIETTGAIVDGAGKLKHPELNTIYAKTQQPIPALPSAKFAVEFLRSLDQFVSLLRDPELMPDIIREQWKVVLTDAEYENYKPHLNSVLERLENDLAGFYAELLISKYWKSIIDLQGSDLLSVGEQLSDHPESDSLNLSLDGYETELALSMRIHDALIASADSYWLARFTDTEFEPNLEPTDNPFQAGSILELPDFEEFVLNKILPIDIEGAQPSWFLFPWINETYANPPSVQFQIDQITSTFANDSREDSADENDRDLQERLAGGVLFGKRFTPDEQDWNTYNLATPSLPLEADPYSFENALLIPASINEVNGERNIHLEVSNENATLVGQTPIRFVDMESEDDRTRDEEEMFFNVGLNVPQGAALTALFYGQQYEFALGYLLNTGVLPLPLRQTDSLVLPKPEFEDLSSLAPASYTHQRRVPVSNLRLTESVADAGRSRVFKKVTFPAIEQEVFPITFDMPEWKARGNDADGTLETDDEVFNTRDRDLVLLFSDEAQFDFQIGKPSTGFWNWYAWMGPEFGGAATEEVAGELREFREAQEFDPTSITEELQKPVYEIDDPAISNFLLIEVRSTFPNKIQNAKLVVAFPQGTLWRRDTIKFTAKYISSSGSADTIGLRNIGTALDPLVEISIPEGQVAKVQFSALVEAKHYSNGGLPSEKMFHDFLGKKPWGRTLTGTVSGVLLSDFVAMPPTEIWIESARRWSPELRSQLENELWQALEIQSTSDKIVARMGITGLLDSDASLGNYEALAQVGNMEIWHQVWNWDGRPIGEFPFSEGNNPDEDRDSPKDGKESQTVLWDAVGFGGRPDFAHLVKQSYLRASRRETDDTIGALSRVSQVVFEEDLRNNPRGLYYRFAVKGFSRYQGHYLNAAGVQGQKTIVTEPSGKDVLLPWKRLYRPCKTLKRLPKPSIRFVIPLTADLTDSGDVRSASSVMIVLNDRWFVEAGLPEKLGVRIEQAESPSVADGGEPLAFWNAGFDPTLSQTSMSNIGQADMDEADTKTPCGFDEAAVQGPYGLTFDFATQTPLLQRTAFILRVPTDFGVNMDSSVLPQGEDQIYFMCQIAIRRELISEGCIASESDSESELKELNSEWTSARWIQYLPNTDLLLPELWRTAANCGEKVHLQFNEQQQVVIDSFHRYEDSYEARLTRWIVLTEFVFDIKGDRVESYRCTLCPLGDSIYECADGSLPEEGSWEGKARVVLLRHRKTPTPDAQVWETDKIWEQLFGDSNVFPQKDPDFAMPIVSPAVAFKRVN